MTKPCKFCGTEPNRSSPDVCDTAEMARHCPWITHDPVDRRSANQREADELGTHEQFDEPE